MFEHGKCPACGFPAGANCTMCGLKSNALRTSKGAWAILSLAASRMSRDARDELAQEVREIEIIVEARSWLRSALGELAEFLRKRRPKAAAGLTTYEKRVSEAASKDRILVWALEDLKGQDVFDACSRFDAVAGEGVHQGFVCSLVDGKTFWARLGQVEIKADAETRSAPTHPDVLVTPPAPIAAGLGIRELIQELMKRTGLTTADLDAAPAPAPARES